jgi:HK97 family phage major capsid protein
MKLNSLFKNRWTLQFLWLVVCVLVAHFVDSVAGMAMATVATLPEGFVEDMKSGLKGIQDNLTKSKTDGEELKTKQKALEDENAKLRTDLDGVRKMLLQRGNVNPTKRVRGFASDAMARGLGAHFILQCAKRGGLDHLDNSVKEKLFTEARGVLEIDTKAALTTTEIPLPTAFTGEIKELIAEFGIMRSQMMPYPIGKGTSRPPRMGTRPAFGSIAMSGSFAEKAPTFGFASLESHKIGGIVRCPRELDEQSIVTLGQFLARYGAIEFARAEDTWALLADGTATYELVSGICKVATTLNRVTTLGGGKTATGDATLDDFRAMRANVNSRVLQTGKYYLHPTWERRLRTFKTPADPFIYVQNAPGGYSTLDGYPIVWTEVLPAYSTVGAPSTFIGVFGDLSYWFFGEHGNPRTDFSSDVFFTTDELATRFIEEIDFDYAAEDAASVIITSAA